MFVNRTLLQRFLDNVSEEEQKAFYEAVEKFKIMANESPMHRAAYLFAAVEVLKEVENEHPLQNPDNPYINSN